ncbi:MAG: CBS domain-containing protein [Bacteroidia bacterium]|nr:CBS domain-containing protein [Bacteroidia bacterium]NNF29768.1 CBS domain-containing protein [Flavobacteriaceae bacterium]MBT8274690.1 CBS domain-containing protein [Bacteroidia bacterium]NNJ82755.1 CBS domain-containing protein [Flavobacteriaceae bacterium]NNK55385.1 CBS domain-containing protein [Flavobacteriaceae bacterium]
MRIQVKDFMTTSVITVKGNTSVGEIRALMSREGFHALPIVKTMPNGDVTIRGIITATDLCKIMDDILTAEQILKPGRVHVIPPNTNAQSAAKNMLKHKIHHLVVMEDGKIIGMVSSQDFVTLVANYALDTKTDTVI